MNKVENGAHMRVLWTNDLIAAAARFEWKRKMKKCMHFLLGNRYSAASIALINWPIEQTNHTAKEKKTFIAHIVRHNYVHKRTTRPTMCNLGVQS